jgi:hypothetical protein
MGGDFRCQELWLPSALRHGTAAFSDFRFDAADFSILHDYIILRSTDGLAEMLCYMYQ